jgi:hypothetical protein
MKSARLTSTLFVLCFALCSCGVGAERQSAGVNANSGLQEAAQAKAEEKPPRPAGDPKKFAVIIAGVGGEEAYTKKFTAQALELHATLTTKLGFDEKQVFFLTESQTGGPENGPRENIARATAEETRKAFDSIKSSATAESLVLVILLGHGSFDGQQAKFNLIGPDLSAKDYAAILGALPTKKIIFINCASSSGEFVKPLSAKDRILITATRSGNEQNATIFAEHLIASLTASGADTDKNGRTSLLESFNYATRLIADWYKQKGRLATEHALIDDNGDGTGHEEATAGDGTISKVTYLDSKTLEEASADAEKFKLLEDRQRLEEEIEKLKARKDEMKPEDYEAELERLLVELATTNQKIKGRQK